MRDIFEKIDITVGEIRNQLAEFPDDMRLTFGSTLDGTPLAFVRVKQKGPDLVYVELTEHPIAAE